LIASSVSTTSSKGINMTLEDASNPRNENNSGGPRRSLRGFAAMDPQRQREIASLGGRAAHQSGHAHEFTSEEARAAGRKRHARQGGGSTEK
jgi:general stress protein YciG